MKHFADLDEDDTVGCYVYIMKLGPYYKVGVTNNVKSRLTQIQTNAPFRVSCKFKKTVHKWYSRRYEKFIHTLLAEYHVRGEWFLCDLKLVKQAFHKAQAQTNGWIAERIAEQRNWHSHSNNM